MAIDLETVTIPKEVVSGDLIEPASPASDDLKAPGEGKDKSAPVATPKDDEPAKADEAAQLEEEVVSRIFEVEGGGYEFRVNPDDRSYGMYKGNTVEELLDNIANGIQEKDRVIRAGKTSLKLKAKGTTTRQQEEGVEQERAPVMDDIFEEELARQVSA